MTKAKTTTARKASTQTADPSPISATATKASRKQRKPARKKPNQKLGPVDTAAISMPPAKSAPATHQPRQTKAALKQSRLAELGGLSLDALMAETGWQAHIIRAALSGLRKSGVTLTRRRAGKDTIYASVAEDPAVTDAPYDRGGEGSDPTSIPQANSKAAPDNLAEDGPTNEVGA
jgi:Protein of unknown function (DUF3489)